VPSPKLVNGPANLDAVAVVVVVGDVVVADVVVGDVVVGGTVVAAVGGAVVGGTVVAVVGAAVVAVGASVAAVRFFLLLPVAPRIATPRRSATTDAVMSCHVFHRRPLRAPSPATRAGPGWSGGGAGGGGTIPNDDLTRLFAPIEALDRTLVARTALKLGAVPAYILGGKLDCRGAVRAGGSGL
jgi:hypothetical protein